MNARTPLVLCALLPASLAWAQDLPPGHPPAAHAASPHAGAAPLDVAKRSTPWPGEALRLADSLPIQERGRVKPLKTFAGFQLLKMNGKRTLKTPGGERLDPVAWLLDVWFFPAQARTYEHFRIQDSDVVKALGLQAKAKRDYYSYDHLEPGLPKLAELAEAYDRKERMKKGSLTSTERETLQLYGSVHEFERQLHFLDFARERYPLAATAGLKQVFGEDPGPGLSPALAKLDGLSVLTTLIQQQPKIPQERVREELAAAESLLHELQRGAFSARDQALWPPNASVAEQTAWITPFSALRGRIAQTFGKGLTPELPGYGVTADPMQEQLEALRRLEAMEAHKLDPQAFLEDLRGLHATVEGLASKRGEYWKVPLEVHYYRLDWFYKALIVYLLALLLLLTSLFVPAGEGQGLWSQGKAGAYLYRGVVVLLSAATLLVVIGIVERCIIRSRPPVSTLYETILFISATGVLTALGIEWINRQRVALSVATVLGTLGMFLAMKYEFREAVTAGDTMTSLVAVLDTNFWLATHVTTVTLGYAAGLLAAAIAHVWLIGQALNLRAGDRAFYRSLARMTYGTICFGLLFSVVGTILGGIWANYSWGRFWGWDPKENGALLIVLWELATLHAKLGGYIRDLGLCIAAVLGGMVVAFSWWGVNLLGTGLHSYGFTDGVAVTLNAFYALEAALALGTGLVIWGRLAGAQAAAASAA
ncbi:MAG: cytochrome c biogenesis protein [Planctomycetota bacterium]